jgi:hypothetical protein
MSSDEGVVHAMRTVFEKFEELALVERYFAGGGIRD